MDNTISTSSASSFLTNFVTGKEQIENFVNQVVGEVESGNLNPLKLKIYTKSLSKAIEEIEKRTAPGTLTEAEKYGEKKFEAYGAKIEMAELGAKYGYAACGDPNWDTLTAEIDRLTKERSDRETFLKTLKEPMSDMEGVVINPPIKRSTTGIKISFK